MHPFGVSTFGVEDRHQHIRFAVIGMPRTVFTMNNTLGDLLEDPRGNVVVNFLASQMGIESLDKAGSDDFMAAAIRQMTFRQIAIFAGAQMPPEALTALLRMINSDMTPEQVRAMLEANRGGS